MITSSRTQEKATILRPRAHQRDAVDAVCRELKEADRAQALMACASGKTAVGLWVAEALDAKTVLVLVPSLALMKQALQEWVNNTVWDDLQFISVCSDSTVTRDLDEVHLTPEEYGEPVTTDPAEVARFLAETNAKVKLIFSTYRSAGVLAEAVGPTGRFDFAVFDEAHRTAGIEGRLNAFALSDGNLRIGKRLFLTATPRTCRHRKNKSGGSVSPGFSMDDERFFGRVAYLLTFREAVRRNLIVPYKIVVSVITSEDLSRNDLQAGSVSGTATNLTRLDIANRLALAAAIKKHGVRRVFTFHQRVEDAKAFTEPVDGIRRYAPEFYTIHVDGTMSAAQRSELLGNFTNVEKGLVANARCLTEGVDVPAVDMVAFMSRRRSTVDIVQAAGRAMRKAPGKDLGYVFLPLFVEIERGESIEDALAQSSFSEVWAVLQALAENDQAFGNVIRLAGEEIGERGTTDVDLSGLVEVVGALDLSQLRRAVATRLVHEIGDLWDRRVGELIKFSRKHGHCSVPQHFPENQQLSSWVTHQRADKMNGLLSMRRVQRLDSLGFVWDYHRWKWDQMYERLKAFKATNGHCRIPVSDRDDPALGSWLGKQRRGRRSGLLSSEQIALMDGLGVEWSDCAIYNAQFERRFSELVAFHERFGHSNVVRTDLSNSSLCGWLCSQRFQHKKGNMPPDRVSRFEALGFLWDYQEAVDFRRLDALKRFKAEYGHCDVPFNFRKIEHIGSWVHVLRRRKALGTIAPAVMEELERIGFPWRSRNAKGFNAGKWDSKFDELVAFKDANGHCIVPTGTKGHELLYNWLLRQRRAWRKGSLPEALIERLKSVGVGLSRSKSFKNIGKPRDMLFARGLSFEEGFASLRAFKLKYGHCRVPARDKEFPGLFWWVRNLRRKHGKGRLPATVVERLTSLGFVWSDPDKQWNDSVERLQAFKAAFGHCKPSRRDPRFKKLAAWLVNNRTGYRAGVMPPDRIVQLTELGVDLLGRNPDNTWANHVENLRAFRKATGHCKPSREDPVYGGLVAWLAGARTQHRAGVLSPERVRQLSEIGVEWEINPVGRRMKGRKVAG